MPYQYDRDDVLCSVLLLKYTDRTQQLSILLTEPYKLSCLRPKTASPVQTIQMQITGLTLPHRQQRRCQTYCCTLGELGTLGRYLFGWFIWEFVG